MDKELQSDVAIQSHIFTGKRRVSSLGVSAVMGACVWLTACGPSPDPSEVTPITTTTNRANDTVVATVNRTSIYASDVQILAQSQGLVSADQAFEVTHPRYQYLLDELIDQRLLAQEAEAIKDAKTPDAQERLAAVRERILSNIRLERHLAENVTDDVVRRVYDEQVRLVSRGDEIRARHILVKTKETADALLTQIKSGGNFAALAKAQSLDAGSADDGGDLGYFTADMLDPKFTAAVFQAGKGEYISPVKSQYGWHIAEVLDRRAPPQKDFEEMREELTNFLTFDAIKTLVSDLRTEADIQIKTPNASDTPTLPEPAE